MAIALGDFVETHREDLLRRCAQKAQPSRRAPHQASRASGIPAFLGQLVAELRRDTQTRNIRDRAGEHGRELYFLGFTASEVVYDYGNVCQAVTELAVEQGADIAPEDFRTLNRCLDDAIASAVESYTHQMRHASARRSAELEILLDSTIMAFGILQAGQVGVGGTTAAWISRSLRNIRAKLAAVPNVSRAGA